MTAQTEGEQGTTPDLVGSAVSHELILWRYKVLRMQLRCLARLLWIQFSLVSMDGKMLSKLNALDPCQWS